MSRDETFEEAVAEYVKKTKELIGTETQEDLPPMSPSPWGSELEPPYESALRLDPSTIRLYAHSIGEDNPLYTDPEYGKNTRYGCQVAPGPVLTMVRYPTSHGDMRLPNGYPIAEFISGTALEFFDVVRAHSRVRTSKVLKEIIEKDGETSSTGKLYFLISEVFYWDFHGDLLGKAYCTQIQVPQESLGTGRAMSPERLGKELMYTRQAIKYDREQVEELAQGIEESARRGSEPRFWEDVNVGDKLSPLVMPPWSLQDQICFKFLYDCQNRGGNIPGGAVAFEPQYHMLRARPGSNHGARLNPITQWPWNPGDEHEDALIAPYRNQPRPFDYGIQRAQIPHQLLSNWMGDDGFVRRFYVAFRRPVYYGDAITYTGEVTRKFVEHQSGSDGDGAVAGEADYHAVGIRLEGKNQDGEIVAPGTATIYLPSQTAGPVRLPVPHAPRPPYISFDTYRKDWY